MRNFSTCSAPSVDPRPDPPTLDDLRPHVEVADTGEHWYWLGDVRKRGLDRDAVFTKDGVRWPVLAILVPTVRGTTMRRVNQCGLATCINPAHWTCVRVDTVITVTNFDGMGWRPV